MAVDTQTGGRSATSGQIDGRYSLSVGRPEKTSPSGWEWKLLTDLARLETGHTPSRKHPEYWDGDIPWVGIKDATSNHGLKIADTYQHVTQLGIDNSSARVLPANTVCLSRTASVGYVVVMGRPMATSQDFVNWVCGDQLDYNFLKYILLSEKDSFLRFASGTTHQTIYFPEAKAFHVCLPCLGEQKAIANILSTLDDKIELNRKTNETLEGIAKALFKSWFVDFDPVRAKAEGRPTGLPDEISDLFPDSFEDSELGEIPSGWSTSQIGNHLETLLGGTPSRKKHEYWGGAIPWIGSGMVNEFRVIKATEMITEEGLANSATKMLPRGSTLIAITGATLGQVSMNEIEVCANQSVVAIKPSTSLGTEYVFLWVKSNIDLLINCQTGGAQQHVNKNDVNNMPLLLPPPSVLERFSDMAAPVFKKITEGLFEQESLSSIRDLLLPRLISGELRVPDAERMLEEVGI